MENTQKLASFRKNGSEPQGQIEAAAGRAEMTKRWIYGHKIPLIMSVATAAIISVFVAGKISSPPVSAKDLVTLCTLILTSAGVLSALLTLQDNHEWNRRQYTLQLMADWNSSTREHLEALHKSFPKLYNSSDAFKEKGDTGSWRIADEEASKMVDPSAFDVAKEDIERYAALRNHLVMILNYFERICVAYETSVVTRKVIAESFAPIITEVWLYFQPCFDAINRAKNREPWPPITRVVVAWQSSMEYLKAEHEVAQMKKVTEERKLAAKALENKLHSEGKTG